MGGAEPRIIDNGPRLFRPDVAVGSREFLQFLIDVESHLDNGYGCWRSPVVERRDGSDIEGRGLFATTDINPGELVAVKGGRIVNEAEVKKLTTEGKLHGSQQQVGFDLFLIGLPPEEEDSNLVGYNHSCEPNAKVLVNEPGHETLGGTVWLLTRKPVATGEEVTVDYSVSHISNTHRFICNCGSPHCRTFIQPRYDYLDPDMQAKYKGEFPQYIQTLIDEMAAMPKAERESLLFSAHFGQIVGKITMIADEIQRLESLSEPDAQTLLRLAKFRQIQLITTAYFISTFPGTAQACGINMKNAKKFQSSVTEKQANIVGYARQQDGQS